MDQVSKPVLIALIAAVALIGVKFTVLRSSSGGGSTPAAATAPGQTGLQNSIDKANHAVGVSKQSAAQHEQAANAASGDASAAKPAASKPAATHAAKAAPAKPVFKPAKPLPKLAPGDRSGPMLRDLANGKVVVALFYNPHGSDDNAALRAVRAANLHHGRVVVHSIPIQDVGNYDAITTGVQVLEAPTIIVMGPGNKARTIVGYTEAEEVDQTIGDIGGKGFQPTAAVHLTGWAAKASNICKDTGFGVLTGGTPTDISSFEHSVSRAIRLEHRDRARVAAVPAAGAKQQAAKRALVHVYDVDAALLTSIQAKLKAHQQLDASIIAAGRHEDALISQARPALHAVHEHHCLG